MMRFHIITIFPGMFDSYLRESLFKRAQAKKIVSVRAYDLRTFTKNKYRKVDDRPFGGGPGMVLAIQPVWDAVKKIKSMSRKTLKKRKVRVILFSTRGKRLDAAIARRLAQYDDLILICGRYEGVDERVAEHIADEEISIGDYVLSGGEIPALALMEAVSRQLPGFLGKEESLEEVNGSFPTFTRPEVFVPAKGKKWSVPSVLLSGDHKKIAAWRKGLDRTDKNRL
jgi:tRNA (guanine37-N1)-methyltransferase